MRQIEAKIISESNPLYLFRAQLKHSFIYFAVIVSLVVLFKPGSDGPLPFPQADKLVHASTFALLALGLWWRRVSWKLILACLAIYALSSEIIQHFFIPGREFDLLDIAADLVGAIFVSVYTRLPKLSSRSVSRRTRAL